MKRERRVSLFRNGRNQAVRIPREFELPGSTAIMRKIGDRLILEPEKRMPLLDVLATLSPLKKEDEFPDIVESLLPPDVDSLDS
jgi:antitoxin VapB